MAIRASLAAFRAVKAPFDSRRQEQHQTPEVTLAVCEENSFGRDSCERLQRSFWRGAN